MAVQKATKKVSTPIEEKTLSARPKVLSASTNRSYQITRAQRTGMTKNGVSNLESLPPGVQESIKNKARIQKVLNTGAESVAISELQSKYNPGKPLTIKTARVITQQRNEFFAENRQKWVNDPEEPIAKKSKLTAAKKTKTKK
ncbi:hypothetical protein [Spiroplasma clarkii]|uniref:Uncharacterized protein n=1 Tax=Spiroplasma clarkii TaxID=2139 RepID=A0A2K8KH36_9MOLU|nr:hypothetical protein [Spiroplasma clarkii]ATX71003.1 hypothetical protein SCLAR_v1c06860 [Spiroplasma clarkii]